MSDLIFYGGNIITVDNCMPSGEAVGVSHGKIVSVGTLADVAASVSADASKIDLAGQTLIPGFIDAHSHLLWAAKTRGTPVVDIRAETVPTYQAVLAKIRRRVAKAKPGEYILFFGLDPQLHPDMEEPTRALLDELAPDNPLGIQTSNCHAVYLNSLAFSACGIDEHTPTPIGSIIERDTQGRPTGKIGEAATWTALDTFYEAWGKQRLAEGLEASVREFLSQGITTITEHLYLPYYKAYYQDALKQQMPMPRIAAYQQATTADMKMDTLSLGDDRVWLAGTKIHADGSPFIGNIWLTQPYLNSPITLERMQLKPDHTGHTNYPAEFFEAMVRTYYAQGWQMSVHTQGDRTIDMVLDIVETLQQETPRPDHRFRLEHCALMRDDQIERANALGVLCSFFINHITTWGAPIEDALFGTERAANYMPAGSAVRSGMRISLHADTPMTDPSGLDLMRAATTREAGDGRCLGPEQCISVVQALRAVTIDAAFQLCKEDSLGSITPGKHADFAILDANPLETLPAELHNISVRATYLAGDCVWTHD